MKDNWLIKKIWHIAVNHFHRWYGFFCSIILLWIVALFIYGLMPKELVPFFYYVIGTGILSFLLFIYWVIYVWYYPKRSKKRLGVAIAIHVEELEDYKFFEKDFISPFRNKICDLNLPFDVLVLKNHQSEKVETVKDARKVLRKTNAHFCIWGSIKKRKNNPAGEKYLFILRGIVVHQPIQEIQKVLLVKEFDALLPNSFAFEENLQFEAFEFRSNQVFTALDYITGRAALLSGDFKTAIQLHEPLFQAIQSGQPYPISIDTLKKILSLEYDLKASFEFFNAAEGESYKESIIKSLQYNQSNYGALLKRAIIEFDDGNGDPKTALATIGQAKQYAVGVYHWLYSKAFLHFWLEEYDDALKCCEKLKGKNYAGEEITIKEVLKFNEDLLKKFDKPQLYYWIGFVSYIKDENLSLADIYFQKFIEKTNDSMNDLLTRAQSYLANIKKEIGYK
ncbi:MAG: hypothetical protein NTX82_07425 [Candidatus Parcubacteria bacterium]|nr:hypothetical protein [Candidatus Parcubacteria bacterium]